MPLTIHSVVNVMLLLFIVADLILRWRRATSGHASSGGYIVGIVPSPVLAVVGAIISVTVGWPGWVLVGAAVLHAAESIIVAPSTPEEAAEQDFDRFWVLTASLILAAEVLSLGVLSSKVFIFLTEVYGNGI